MGRAVAGRRRRRPRLLKVVPAVPQGGVTPRAARQSGGRARQSRIYTMCARLSTVYCHPRF